MPLMRICAYQRLCFADGQAPDRRTIISRINRGDLYGFKQGGIWYVDPDVRPPAPIADSIEVSRLLATFGVKP